MKIDIFDIIYASYMSVNQNEIVINYKESYWTSASQKDAWRLVFVSAKNNQDVIISSMERQFYRMETV